MTKYEAPIVSIRAACIGGMSDSIRSVLLTSHQLEVLTWVINIGTGTTSRLASHLGCSEPAASNALHTLYAKGYLSRNDRPDPTGGRFFVYELRPELQGRSDEWIG